MNEITSAIDSLIPVIEIIASRFKGGFENLGPIKLIADMVVHRGLVKGVEFNKWEKISGWYLNHTWRYNVLSQKGYTINEGGNKLIFDYETFNLST